MKERVKQALEQIRPALQADGGDVEFADVTENGDVQVRLTGAGAHDFGVNQIVLQPCCSGR